MRVIVVGADGVAREVLQRLSEAWQTVVIDTSEAKLERARLAGARRTFRGDGSSRIVLLRAGLAEADALIAATADDEVNLEACRQARQAGLRRVLAVARDPERLLAYHDLGVPAFSPDRLAARQLELHLERRRIVSTAFADGRAEAIEFRVEPDSPVCGRPLSELRASSWLVGAILRGDRLIVPHGETTLEAGDLVTVVGSASDFSSIVRTFTAGQPRFPLDYGKRIAVLLDGQQPGTVFDEALWLARNSRATSLLAFYPAAATRSEETQTIRDILERAAAGAEGVEVRPRPAGRRPRLDLEQLPEAESVGALVVGAPDGTGVLQRIRTRRLLRLALASRRPLLASRGTQPYGRILVPARRTATGTAAMRVAIDLACVTGADLVGLAVLDPPFVGGSDGDSEAHRALDWLQEEAAVQSVSVRREARRGNPVRVFVDLSREVELVVTGLSSRSHPFQVRIAAHLVARSLPSVLIVPAPE